MDHIYNLSVRIGRRGTATEGEYRARDYIKDTFDALGMESTVEPFRTIPSFSYPYILIYLISIAGALFLLLHRPVVSIVFTGVGAVTFFLENSSFEVVSLLLPKRASYNVIGHVPASGRGIHRVIVTAHYDSSRSGIMFSPRFVKGFRNTFIGIVISMFTMFILTAMYWITRVLWLKVLVGILALDPLVTVILLMHREIKGQYTQGANDNASGVGVLLGIAERFSTEPLRNTEIYLVATGAEEVGMAGMLFFVREHRDLLKDAFVINIDNCGSGRVSYIIEEGMIKQYPADHSMVAMADKIVKESSMHITPRVFTTMSTDALVPLSRGYRAMSIMAFDDEGVLPNWHWETDVFENVRPAPVNLAYEFASKMIGTIESREEAA
ncbi:MAG: M28 family metallopeptidase [Deltaproteobacteria bacterium]|nr:M28 family metallopeptidase [Deltaproteobacteria bacterium]MCL5276916.1 M28 family metallopeptidase [Deltaproteobacteria bacterium]